MKQKLAILAVVVAIAALGCWSAKAFYNPNVLSVDVAMTGDVAVDGKKPVVFSGSLDPSAPNPKVRVSWIIGKFQMQDASGTAVVWDGFMPGSTNTVYKDYTVGTTFNFTHYAFGVANSGIDDQAITIEALHNTPMEDTVNFTVFAVDKIEYQRFDLSTWVTDLNIAAGAKDTDVHKAHVRITIVPAEAGVEVLPAINGGGGDAVASTLTPSTSLTTDSSGQVTTDYKSSDKTEDATIKVISLADCAVSIDLGSTFHHKWDCAGKYDWIVPELYILGVSDDVRYYPTLDESGGKGAIDTHDIQHYAPWVHLLVLKLDFSTGDVTPTDVYGTYPDYWYSDTTLPSWLCAMTVDQFVEITALPEESTGIYPATHTVNGYFYEDSASLTLVIPVEYKIGAYDMDVYYVP